MQTTTAQIVAALNVKPADDNWLDLQASLMLAARNEALAGNTARAAHLMLVAGSIVNDSVLMNSLITKLYDGLRAAA